tara:strand:+ start:2957 stop:3970 length:1014 start_codon:yes stop_codon:yes gene_type:complete
MLRPAFALGVLLLLAMLPLASSVQIDAQNDEPVWRSVGLDPDLWTDRPEAEESPMMVSYQGNAVIEMNVSYQPGWGEERVEGSVVIELFENWAPITTNNMIDHVESGLYDGVFFHRVINDFVTQAGDPTCKTVGIYPAASPSCGSGGTGETIPLEHNNNLSHVDGALGMARSAEPDSADSQWYIAETEAHNLDPENRDDEGYATFGIVRDGMQHIRAIAEVPTTDEPTGTDVDNPFASAGRPLLEVSIVSMKMIGVADPDGTIRTPVDDVEEGSSFLQNAAIIIGVPFAVVLLGGGFAMFVHSRVDEDSENGETTVLEAETLVVAELVEPGYLRDED